MILKEDLMELIDVSKLKQLLNRNKKEEIIEENKCCPWKMILGIVAVAAAIAGIAFALYRYFASDYQDDLLDDFDDDFGDDDLFEDDDPLDEESETESEAETKEE